jgi:hypothetical protein
MKDKVVPIRPPKPARASKVDWNQLGIMDGKMGHPKRPPPQMIDAIKYEAGYEQGSKDSWGWVPAFAARLGITPLDKPRDIDIVTMDHRIYSVSDMLNAIVDRIEKLEGKGGE